MSVATAPSGRISSSQQAIRGARDLSFPIIGPDLQLATHGVEAALLHTHLKLHVLYLAYLLLPFLPRAYILFFT